MLATFNEYHWSFPTCGAQISYKTNTLGRSVESWHTAVINNAENNSMLLSGQYTMLKRKTCNISQGTTL